MTVVIATVAVNGSGDRLPAGDLGPPGDMIDAYRQNHCEAKEPS
jgi:hypothetical protein